MYEEPTILITTGHEGSSTVMQILQYLGLFLGTNLREGKKKIFYEHKTVQRINQQILEAKGFPYPWPLYDRQNILAKWLSNEAFIKSVRGQVVNAFEKEGLKSYQNWGFKDPRTCITFPFWLKVFPDAKFIFLSRDNEDTQRGWNAKGDWGFKYFKDYWKLNVAMAPFEQSFILLYDDLTYKFEDTCKQLVDFIGLSEVGSYGGHRVASAKSMWKPKYAGKYVSVN